VQLRVVTGVNKSLFVHLQRIRADLKVPATIYGFVHNMPEMMHAADVIVTKAGPGSICEALACNLPIILSGFVPGQEEGNVTYVTENRVGVLARTPVEMVDALRRLIKPGSSLLQEELENARRLSHPRASFEIVRHILNYLPAPGEQSIWQRTGPLALIHAQSHLQRHASLQTGRRRFPLRVAVVSPSHLGKNIARLGMLRRPRIRSTGPLDLRKPSRRLPPLLGRANIRDQK